MYVYEQGKPDEVKAAALPVCLECEQPLGARHDPGCGKRVIGCPEVVMDDCADEDARDAGGDIGGDERTS